MRNLTTMVRLLIGASLLLSVCWDAVAEESDTSEMTLLRPPVDLDAQAPAFVYAVTARPAARPSLPQYTTDGDPKTYWSAQAYPPYTRPGGQWCTYHLSKSAKIDAVRIIWAQAAKIQFDVRTSPDGKAWTVVSQGTTSGKTSGAHEYRFEPVDARFVRVTIHNSTRDKWLGISEVRIGSLEYKPTPQMRRWSKRYASGLPGDEYLDRHNPTEPPSYTEMAARCLRTLIEKGTDRYGRAQAPIWVLNLDLESLDCFPNYNDALIECGARSLGYSWLAPYGVGHRAIRDSQRAGGCSNLFVDQPMIRAAVLLDRLRGKREFTPAVESYIRWYFEHLTSEKTGLLEWGVHSSYDVFTEQLKHSDGYQHEVLGILPIWPAFYQADPEATKAYLEKFWYWHTDAETGVIDRHATRGHGLDFAGPAGEIILACAYLHTLSADGPWLDRALKIAHSHFDSRNPKTNLFVNTPHGGTGKRFDNTYTDTSVTGLWASCVLLSGRLTGNRELTEMAHKFLVGWAQYGWDEEGGKPWASLQTDGTPNRRPRDYTGTTYSKFEPSSYWDFWMDYVYGFENPFGTLMTYAVAARWLDDPLLEAHAVRLAECYRRLLPANGKYGTFAANYGQLISFYLAMEELTGDPGYRQTARKIADEAVHHLWTGKMFRGFAGRTHYTAVEGAGYLCQALVELDADPKTLAELRAKNVFLWNF